MTDGPTYDDGAWVPDHIAATEAAAHLVIGAHYGWVKCSCDPDRHLSMTEFNTHIRDQIAAQVEGLRAPYYVVDQWRYGYQRAVGDAAAVIRGGGHG